MACIKERIKGSKVTPHLGLCCQNGIEGLRTILVVLLLLRFRVKQTLTRDDPVSWPSAWQDPHENKAKWQYSPGISRGSTHHVAEPEPWGDTREVGQANSKYGCLSRHGSALLAKAEARAILDLQAGRGPSPHAGAARSKAHREY